MGLKMHKISIEIKPEHIGNKLYHRVKAYKNSMIFWDEYLTVDEIEQVEVDLSAVLMQLYGYRKHLGDK